MSRLTDDREHDFGHGPPNDDSAVGRDEPAGLFPQRTDWEDRDLRGYEPVHPRGFDWRRLGRALVAPFIGIALLFWKLKFVFVAIFKFKIFTTAGTMLISIGAYALAWGWLFAVGFVLLIFVHEMGHYLEAKRQGLNVGAPVFIPFLGAFIALKDQPLSVWQEFKVAAAGPLLGSLAAAGCWAVYGLTGREFWLALAFVGFLINLFNLAPVWQLDGGRMISAIHPGLWIPGLVGLGVLLYFYPSPILIIIVLLGAFQAYSWWQNRGAPENQRYYQATPVQRVIAAVIYIGLAAALGLAMSATHLERDI